MDVVDGGNREGWGVDLAIATMTKFKKVRSRRKMVAPKVKV